MTSATHPTAPSNSASSQPLRVAVVGASGRMGRQVCAAVDSADDLLLVARIDLSDPLDLIVASKADVVVDFTVPDAVMATVTFCAAQEVDLVVGTTGFTEERLEDVRELLGGEPRSAVLIAPNFGIGAVLMMRFAREAAPWFESVEIVELHHPDKVDAPSGTAQATARGIAGARAAAGRDPSPDATNQGLDGARGAKVDDVHIHSVRARGLVAHQEVLLGNSGETLTIRHDSLDRSSFMPGVLLAVRGISSRKGLVVGIDEMLDAV